MWLLPTKRRIEMLNRFFVAAKRTHVSTYGIVLVEKNEFAELHAEYDRLERPNGWTYYATDGGSLGDKLREVWPLYCDAPWVGLMVDDVIPKTIKWDEVMLEHLKPGRIISANDGHVAPHRMICPIFSAEVIKAIGWYFPDGFNHLFVDDVWETIGRDCAIWDVIMQVKLEHQGTFQTGIADETHKASYANWEHDKARYQRWAAEEKDACIERVKGIKHD